jgi:hypothetical protein
MKPNIVLVGVLFELFLAALAFVFCALFGLLPMRVAWPATFDAAGGLLVLSLALSLPPFAVLVAFDRHPPKHFDRIKGILWEQVMPLFEDCGVIQFIALSIAAGIGEEMLFRGFLQELLVRSLPGTAGMVAAVVITNLAFGLVHRLTWMYAFWAFCMGLYLSLVYAWTENLLAAVLVHAAYDALALIYLDHQMKRSANNCREA